MRDIADEEKEHAGEFLRLLHEIEPAEEEFYGTATRRSRR
jgi:rubrerythrin